LFEVQQQNTIKIKELETAASDRDAQYQEDIAAEVERREDAEEVIRVREALIVDLQASLTETEERMAALLALRDARIAELEAELVDKTAEIALLEGDLRDAESRLTLQTTGDQARREELEASILSLQDTITGYEVTIKTMERENNQATDLHNSEIDDRNSAIASLNHNVAVLQGKVADLENDKAGLENRVNAEAEAMLNLSNEKENEIKRLKKQLNEKHEKILEVEKKLVITDQEWEKELNSRDREIEEMRKQAETTTTTFEEVSMQRDSLKQQFEAYIRRSAGVIDHLKDALEKARNTVANEGDALKAEGGDLLEQLEGLDVVTELVSKKKTVTTQTNSSSQSSAGASRRTPAKASRKKRIYDSGFGVASDEFEDSLAH
jgi:chromosome segregation ATPase